MKIQKIGTYSNYMPQFKSYDDSCNYDWGTDSSQITFKDAITSSAIISGLVLFVGFIFDKGSKVVEKFSKNKKSLHINKLI